MRSWTGGGGLEKKITRKGQGLFMPYMMLLAEATPKIWSSGHTLELGLQRSGSTQVQGLQNHPPSHQCNPTNSQFGKRERDLTYFACKRTRSGTIQAALPLKEK